MHAARLFIILALIMSLKITLQQKSNQWLRQYSRGSFATLCDRQRIMNRIIDDLADLNILPKSFELLSAQHVEQLVEYWRVSGLSTATIANYLSVLRAFSLLIGYNWDIPSNASLKSVKTPPKPRVLPKAPLPLSQIYHPATRSVIELQRWLGLTRLEAIRLDPEQARVGNQLVICRSMAHNKKDRCIPLLCKEQIRCLQHKITLNDTCPLFQDEALERSMSQLYQAECQHAGIDPHTPIRSLYAQHRLNMLKETLNERIALHLLCEEMGFSAPRKLAGLLP
jgi:site-specific recombinase XerC